MKDQTVKVFLAKTCIIIDDLNARRRFLLLLLRNTFSICRLRMHRLLKRLSLLTIYPYVQFLIARIAMTSAGLTLIILLLEVREPLGWHLLVLNTQIHLLILWATSNILSSCRTVNAHFALMSNLLDIMTLQSRAHLLLLMKLEVPERLLCILTRILVHIVEPRSKMRTLQHSIRAVKWLLICCIIRKIV